MIPSEDGSGVPLTRRDINGKDRWNPSDAPVNAIFAKVNRNIPSTEEVLPWVSLSFLSCGNGPHHARRVLPSPCRKPSRMPPARRLEAKTQRSCRKKMALRIETRRTFLNRLHPVMREEAGETRQPEPTVGNIPVSLHRLAALDTNIAALVGWGLVPHLEGGALVLAGLESLDAESRDGVTRWLDRRNNSGEPRSERVARALRTGRRCSC